MDEGYAKWRKARGRPLNPPGERRPGLSSRDLEALKCQDAWWCLSCEWHGNETDPGQLPLGVCARCLSPELEERTTILARVGDVMEVLTQKGLI